MSDDPRDDQTKGQGDDPDGAFPAQWQRHEEGTIDLEATQEGQASFIAGDDMSLGSKLRGGGQDQSAETAGEATRLCPACSTVTVFVDGRCTNCEYLVGSTAHEGAQEIRQAFEGDDHNPTTRILLMVMIAIVVIAILAIGIPKMLARSKATSKEAEAEATAEMYNSEKTFSGSLDEIEVDAQLHEDITTALLSGNAGWATEGVDAFVYKYSLNNDVVQATSQTIRINAYVGGDDAHQAIGKPNNVPFMLGTADLRDRLNATPGVETTIRLYNFEGEETRTRGEVYIKYGYYYGLEHMGELQPLIEGLTQYYRDFGEYPHELTDKVIRSQIKTKKGYYFVADGIGYLPIFKTDLSNNIIMGTGAGTASYKPESCVSYYLVKYTRKTSEGLDLHSKSAEDYYANKIAPFPYAPKDPVQNVSLEPDGEPDGIACVVKDGVLVRD